MLLARAPFAFLSLFLAHCTTVSDARPATPAEDPWPVHAAAIIDSVRLTLMVYGERFNAADRDSVQRFYAEDSGWKWATDGRMGKSSHPMIRSRLDRLATYPQWHLGYRDLLIIPLRPGLAVVFADFRMGFDGAPGKALVNDGAQTVFWEHRAGGWKMVGGHTSSRPAGER